MICVYLFDRGLVGPFQAFPVCQMTMDADVVREIERQASVTVMRVGTMTSAITGILIFLLQRLREWQASGHTAGRNRPYAFIILLGLAGYLSPILLVNVFSLLP